MYCCTCIQKMCVVHNFISLKMTVSNTSEINTIQFVYDKVHDTPDTILRELEEDAHIMLENNSFCESGLQWLTRTRAYKIQYER